MNLSVQLNNETVKVLIADVVHKIKNGLGGIGGYATLLEREFQHTDPKIRFVKKINEGVINVNEIVIKLMSLVRMRDIQKEKIKIEYLFREILKNISNNNEELINNLKFDNNFQGKYIEIVSDQEVMSELFKNSIQFIQEINGEIEKIYVKPLNNKNFSLQIYFRKKYENDQNISIYIDNLMKNSTYIYARLCFAITQYMINLLNGSFSTQTTSDGISILKFEL